jgi:hypothetical protein
MRFFLASKAAFPLLLGGTPLGNMDSLHVNRSRKYKQYFYLINCAITDKLETGIRVDIFM